MKLAAPVGGGVSGTAGPVNGYWLILIFAF